MKNHNIRMADVLREVNRARKAMRMVAPLSKMPKGFVLGGCSPLSIALGATYASAGCGCGHCGFVSGDLGFLKEEKGAAAKVMALRGIWRRAYFKEMPGGYFVGLPRLLARFQRNFEDEMYPELVIERAKKVAA